MTDSVTVRPHDSSVSVLAQGEPALRIISLGAGVQSTTMLLLACEGILPKPDAAIFADTGWEPRAVYEHLDRLTAIAAEHDIPVYRVCEGNIRADALDANHRFASMPLHILNPDGSKGMARRQCTSEYKIKPIKRKVRELLGYPHPKRIPAGVWVEQWIGISRDEVQRAKDSRIRFMRNRFPLLEMTSSSGREGWSRGDCQKYLAGYGAGMEATAKSACIGCPFHDNATWRQLRDTDPEAWADAIDFDQSIRLGSARANANGSPMRGTAYLHPQRIPLDQADLRGELKGQIGFEVGCSPFDCRNDGR
jgi:3'-phosphoadenosine 5'-phosphosulfate sulfotransferase (PAPS reductase)/FAD synthetase